VFAGLQALRGLRGMHLRGGAQDDGVDFGQRQAIGQIGGHVRDAVLACHLFGRLAPAADQGHHLHAVDVANAVQVLDAEGTGAGQRHFDSLAHVTP